MKKDQPVDKQTKEMMKSIIDKVQHQMFKDIEASFKKNLKNEMTVLSTTNKEKEETDEIFDRIMFYIVNSLDVTQVTNEEFRLKNTSIEKQYNDYIKNTIQGIGIQNTEFKSNIEENDKNKTISVEFELVGNGSDGDQKAALAAILGGEVHYEGQDGTGQSVVENVVMEAHNSYSKEYTDKVEKSIENWMKKKFKTTVKNIKKDYDKEKDKDKEIRINWSKK